MVKTGGVCVWIGPYISCLTLINIVSKREAALDESNQNLQETMSSLINNERLYIFRDLFSANPFNNLFLDKNVKLPSSNKMHQEWLKRELISLER